MREYLNRECAAQTTINRAVLLWASAKVPGLLEPKKQKTIITELLGKQQANGGWSFEGTSSTSDLDIDTTGVAIRALVAGGAPASDPDVAAGLAFLAGQQQADGSWQAFGASDPNSTAMA